jgi:hypothetical protein
MPDFEYLMTADPDRIALMLRTTVCTLLRVMPLAALALGVAGCSMLPEWSQFKLPSIDSSTFALGNTGGAIKSSASARAVTNDDLVDAQGHCSGAGPAAVDNSLDPALASQPSLSRGVALEMTECDVARLLGPPANVEMQPNEGGERRLTMTYTSGVRPGIYRFAGGRLKSIERGATPEEPKPQKKQAPKKVKKPANA